MKKNLNYFWAEVAVHSLVRTDVKHAVLCPGSRNTPLNIAFSNHPDIKTYIFTDERSAAFFALGLARKLNEAVAIVTTSGTAVAELHPAVIESYYQRIPLIILSADRPPELFNCGANQTINQKNLFRNSIRNFYDISIPDLSVKKLNQLTEFVARAAKEAAEWKKGPVQLNFPFRKPLEPFNSTDEIEDSLIEKYLKKTHPILTSEKKRSMKRFEMLEIYNKFRNSHKGFIIIGPGQFDEMFYELLSAFSDVTGFPIIAEASSGVTFNAEQDNNIINNFNGLLQSESFINEFVPDTLIHFGKAPVCKSLLQFYANSNAEKFSFNQFRDYEDPSKTTKNHLQIKPESFMRIVLEESPKRKEGTEGFLGKIKELNIKIEETKKSFIEETDLDFEGRIITDIIASIPDGSNLFLANSTPIRDASFFAPVAEKEINVFHNRGVSGIDGLIASASGIAAESEKPTYLIIGDLAFTHDLNSLLSVAKYTTNLHLILVDNNGGGIFEMLPISNLEEGFEELFKTPVDLKFDIAAKAFGVKFVKPKDSKDFLSKLKKTEKEKTSSIIYVPTDAKKSVDLRNSLWQKVNEITTEFLNES